MRKLILVLILLLGIGFIAGSMQEMEETLASLRAGNWRFIGLAALVEGLWLLNIGASYKVIYEIVGLKETHRRLIFLSTAANFISVITPAAGGVPAIAVFLNDANHRGHAKGRVLVAWTINLLFDYVGLLVVVTLGLVVMLRRNNLHLAGILAFLILLVIAIGIAALLYLGTRSPATLAKVLAWMAQRVNRVYWFFTHRPYLNVERAYSFAEDAAEGMLALRSQPGRLWQPLVLALTNKALLVTILMLIFLAFNTPFSSGTLIGGFGISYLFVIVSPTPSGIGIVEGVLALTLRSLGVPLGAATLITISFRGLTFWLPLVIGLFTLREVSKGSRPLPEVSSETLEPPLEPERVINPRE